MTATDGPDGPVTIQCWTAQTPDGAYHDASAVANKLRQYAAEIEAAGRKAGYTLSVRFDDGE